MRIIGRIMALTEPEVEELLANVFAEFHGRHHRLHDFFLRRFEAVSRYLLTDLPLSNARKELIGSSHTAPEIQRYLGADSLGYLSLEGMLKATGSDPTHFCHA